MSVEHKCDNNSSDKSDVCLCQSCFDERLSEEHDEGYKKGFEDGSEKKEEGIEAESL